MNTPDTILTTRNAHVADLVALLQAQHAAKLDVVAPARQNGYIHAEAAPAAPRDGLTT